MMADVVARGTAAGEGLPVGTFAKTGTAEYGTGPKLKTDAWLIGFRGDVAFAIVVVNGGFGGPTDGRSPPSSSTPSRPRPNDTGSASHCDKLISEPPAGEHSPDLSLEPYA